MSYAYLFKYIIIGDTGELKQSKTDKISWWQKKKIDNRKKKL